MSTSCLISKKIGQNKYRTIYCHNDGYLKGVGKTLINFYNSDESVDNLLDLGDISSLGANLYPNKDYPHTFYKPQDNVVVAYHRDRNDPYLSTEATNESMEELMETDNDFIYIWENNEWFVLNWYSRKLELVRNRLRNS